MGVATTKDIEKAIFYFERVLKKAKIPYAYFGLGMAYFMNDQRAMVLEIITNLRSMDQEDLATQLENIVRGHYYADSGPGALVNREQQAERQKGIVVPSGMEQQEAVLSQIPEWYRPIFQFMMEYGCRPGEARALKKDCIVDGQVIFRRAFSNNTLRETTKTDRVRRYDITPYFKEVLADLPLHTSPFVFVRDDGKPYTSKNLNKIWHEACDKAGIHIKLYNGCKHSLGCQLLDMGCDMDLVRQQLGHTKIEMTQRYAKRTNAVLTSKLIQRRKNIVEFKRAKEGNIQ